jgi:hypothetical protein
MNWDAAAVARLEELWADRTLSTAEIGIVLGCNKNMVIGKAHRLKLPPRGKPTHASGVRRPLAPRAPRPSRAKVPPPVPPKPKPKPRPKPKKPKPPQPATILQLDTLMQMCRWPLGATYDRPPYFYCAKPVALQAYCEEHARIAYTGTRPTPKEAAGWTR